MSKKNLILQKKVMVIFPVRKKGFKNKFVKVSCDSNYKMLKIKWLEVTFLMTDEDYKKIVFKIRDIVENNDVKLFFNDMRKFNAVISLEMQEWVYENFFVYISERVKKIAILPSEEYTSKVSINLIADKINSLLETIRIELFSDEKKAMEWLLQ